jgi:DNA-binding MarR family transcriptional regulator
VSDNVKDNGEADGLEWGLFESRVGPIVRLLRNELTMQIGAAQAPFGLRFGALSTMVLVQANPGCSQADLARELAIDKSMLVAIVDELETRSLAVRTRSKEDRRRNSLALTAEGERVMHAMFAAADTVERPIREAMSAKELATLMRLLRRAHAALVGAGGKKDNGR